MCCLEKKRGDRNKREREKRRGGGAGCLVLRNWGIRGGEGREQTGGSGVEVRGGWLAPMLGCVCGERRAGAGLITIHIKVIIRDIVL